MSNFKSEPKNNTEFSLSLSRRASEKLTWGLGYFVLGTHQFSYDTIGVLNLNNRVLNLNAKSVSRAFQAAVAYQVNPKLSLGASLGLVLSSVSDDFRETPPFSEHVLAPQVRLGVNYRVSEGFRVGLMASSQANTPLKNSSKANKDDLFPAIPATVGLGLFYDFGFVQVDFDMVHYMYSATHYSRAFDWKNSNSFQLNIEKKLDSNWSLGLGVMDMQGAFEFSDDVALNFFALNTYMSPVYPKTYWSAYIGYETNNFGITLTCLKAVSKEKKLNRLVNSQDPFLGAMIFNLNYDATEVEDALIIKTAFKF